MHPVLSTATNCRRQYGLARLVVKDVKAAVSNLNLSASEGSDSFKNTEKKFLGAFKCFMDFNETQQQASLQVRAHIIHGVPRKE